MDENRSDIIIRGPGGINHTVTGTELDEESDRLIKKRQRQRIKTPSTYHVVPTSKNVNKDSITRLVNRIKGNG